MFIAMKSNCNDNLLDVEQSFDKTTLEHLQNYYKTFVREMKFYWKGLNISNQSAGSKY